MASLSPDRRWLAILARPALPPLAELAEEELRLAGVRFKPKNNVRSRVSHYTHITLLDLHNNEQRAIAGLPEEGRIGHVTWSPDARWLAFSVTDAEACRLWLADVDKAESRLLITDRLNAAAGAPIVWCSDSQALIIKAIDETRGPRPEPPEDLSPAVQESEGGKSSSRTFQDLLASPHDERLFEYYLTSQIRRVSLAGETVDMGARAFRCARSPRRRGTICWSRRCIALSRMSLPRFVFHGEWRCGTPRETS